MPSEVRPITDEDIPAVASFLAECMVSGVTAEAWTKAVDVPWVVDAPNHGFLLHDGSAVVGAYLAFYSERVIDGRPERFCNLGAWCVRPEHRVAGLRLLKALLGQKGFHFTDLSPSGNVIAFNTRNGFEFLDTSTAVVPNLPWPTRPGQVRVTSRPDILEATLTGDELRRWRDHRHVAAARHVLLVRGDAWCYVVFRKERRKGLPLFASVLHVSHPAVFQRFGRAFFRHLLVRHRVLATFVELRVVNHRPRPSFALPNPRPRMFKSERLAPTAIDYLYSELVCVAW